MQYHVWPLCGFLHVFTIIGFKGHFSESVIEILWTFLFLKYTFMKVTLIHIKGHCTYKPD